MKIVIITTGVFCTFHTVFSIYIQKEQTIQGSETQSASLKLPKDFTPNDDMQQMGIINELLNMACAACSKIKDYNKRAICTKKFCLRSSQTSGFSSGQTSSMKRKLDNYISGVSQSSSFGDQPSVIDTVTDMLCQLCKNLSTPAKRRNCVNKNCLQSSSLSSTGLLTTGGRPKTFKKFGGVQPIAIPPRV